jgi:23S rRNA pseudouridine2605 synthase
MPSQRLSKVLASSGVASRRKCEELILSGKVSVNGQVVRTPQTLVDALDDEILLAGKKLSPVQEKVYYMCNKPAGLFCTSEAVAGKRSVLSLFPKGLRLFTIGRLDKDTKGLLLVTNDGHFAQLIHPSRRISKEYVVKTDKEITDQHLKAISAGGLVEGTYVKPASVKKVRKGTLKIVIQEGKKREVRTLVENAGLEVLELKRTRIGGVVLGRLREGEIRLLKEHEKRELLSHG